MGNDSRNTIQFTITGRQGVTLLPRCLQLLSRRGFIVHEIRTNPLGNHKVEIFLSAEGDSKWNAAVPHLISRLVDVDSVRVEENDDA